MLKIVSIYETENVILSEVRKSKLAKIKNEKSRLLSLAAEEAYNRISLELLGEILPYTYKNQKPENGKFFFNLSHSGEYAVCAASKTPVGVDIQEIRPVDLKLAERFFTKDEFEYIKNGKNKEERFFEIWTKKEAMAKVYGEGIAEFFKSESVFLAKDFEFEMNTSLDGYIICICTAKAVQ